MNSLTLLVISGLSFLTSAQVGNCTECTCPPNITVAASNPPGSYVYTTFLQFYSDNIYFRGYTFGDLYQVVIWMHLFLAPTLVFLIYLYRMRTVNTPYSEWKRGVVGMSTRKIVLWLTGLICCAVDIVFFLWWPLTDVIIFTFSLHVFLFVWGLWLIYLLWMMPPEKYLAKAKYLCNDGNAMNNIESFRSTVQGVNPGDLIINVTQSDAGKYIGVINVPTLSSGNQHVTKRQFVSIGDDIASARRGAACQANTYLLTFSPYLSIASKVSVGHNEPVVSVVESHLDEPSVSRMYPVSSA